MRKSRLGTSLAVLFGVVLAGVIIGQFNTGGRIYNVRQLKAIFAHNAMAWNGRVIRVRGLVSPQAYLPNCPIGRTCPQWANLFDPPIRLGYVPAPAMSLAPDPVPWLITLRGLPVIGRIIPGPQQVDWRHPATYVVQIVVRHCRPTTCIYARLVNSQAWYAGRPMQ